MHSQAEPGNELFQAHGPQFQCEAELRYQSILKKGFPDINGLKLHSYQVEPNARPIDNNLDVNGIEQHKEFV